LAHWSLADLLVITQPSNNIYRHDQCDDFYNSLQFNDESLQHRDTKSWYMLIVSLLVLGKQERF